MRTAQKKLTILFAATSILLSIMACEKNKLREVGPNSDAAKTQPKTPEPILLESIKSGYKFYSPCINYSGKIAKNEGC